MLFWVYFVVLFLWRRVDRCYGMVAAGCCKQSVFQEDSGHNSEFILLGFYLNNKDLYLF